MCKFHKYNLKFSEKGSSIPTWEDQCEWHRMTRATGPDCAVMCNFINTHTHTQTTKQKQNIMEPGNVGFNFSRREEKKRKKRVIRKGKEIRKK